MLSLTLVVKTCRLSKLTSCLRLRCKTRQFFSQHQEKMQKMAEITPHNSAILYHFSKIWLSLMWYFDSFHYLAMAFIVTPFGSLMMLMPLCWRQRLWPKIFAAARVPPLILRLRVRTHPTRHSCLHHIFHSRGHTWYHNLHAIRLSMKGFNLKSHT